MNSNDPLFKNYMALFLSIVSKHSVKQSLMAIGLLGHSKRKKEFNWDDLDKEYENIAHDDI